MGKAKKKEYQLDVDTDQERDIFDDWADWLHDLERLVGRWRQVTLGPPADYHSNITKASMEHATLRYIKKPLPRWNLYF